MAIYDTGAHTVFYNRYHIVRITKYRNTSRPSY